MRAAIEKLCVAPPGVPDQRFEKSGSFRELFAGSGGVTGFLSHRGDTDSAAFEAYPAASDDSGLKAPEYRAEHDLLFPMVVLSLLVDIYRRAITRLHLGPPCQTWGLLFQNLGPGTRTDAQWAGDCSDERETRGNRTMGVAILLPRAIWEIYGTASFEHSLTTRIWKLRSVRAILGLPGCRKVRIDQRMYGLRPGDDVGGSKRYLKPTGLLLCGSAPFDTRLRDHSHEHTQIIGSYRHIDGQGKSATIQRSHAAGAYPPALCSCLGVFHAK